MMMEMLIGVLDAVAGGGLDGGDGRGG